MLDEADQLRVRIVVVAFGPRESLAHYQHRQRLDQIQVLSDPDRLVYQAFGLGRGTLLRVWFDPRVWVRYAQLVRRGRPPEPAHEDTLQLGGDALVSADGRIAWIYRSRGPEDRPSLARIQAALSPTCERPPLRPEPPGAHNALMDQLERQSAGLRVKALEKVYADGTHALRGVSLRIPGGCFYGLLGPNGSGKTTLIGMTCGLVRAPPGRLFVFGHDVVSDAPRARQLVGVATQEIHLDRFLSVREVLVYHGRYFGMDRVQARRRADDLLDAFDLSAKGQAKPNRLSGGMRRRVLIARALVHRPRLLILDEPTAGVDLELRRELWRYLRGLQARERTTMLLTTHYLEEAQALCERVAFIRDGRILAEGTSAQLAARYGAEDLQDAYVTAMRR